MVHHCPQSQIQTSAAVSQDLLKYGLCLLFFYHPPAKSLHQTNSVSYSTCICQESILCCTLAQSVSHEYNILLFASSNLSTHQKPSLSFTSSIQSLLTPPVSQLHFCLQSASNCNSLFSNVDSRTYINSTVGSWREDTNHFTYSA